MGNSCWSKQEEPESASHTNGTRESRGPSGRPPGRRRTRDRVRSRVRGRKRGSSAMSLGSPHPTEHSLSSDTMYFDARDTMSEDGPARLSRGSSYQDGIDDYPGSPSGSSDSPRHYFRTMSQEKAAQLAADSDALLEPDDMNPVTCLPRILAGKDSSPKTFVRLTRPRAGSSLRPASVSTAAAAAVASATVPETAPAVGASLLPSSSGRQPPLERWEDPPGDQFMVRGCDYMKTKKKVPSAHTLYRLLDIDIYSFDFRLGHIAKHVQLPPPPTVGEQSHLPHDQQLPPLLIINIQLPDYPASIFGRNDGPGCSIVLYFGLPEGWTPEQEPNQAAVGLLQRFVHNGTEADGTPTRDRLKLIPRVVNVDEWSVNAPLSSTEQALLRRYNDKPLLTRPQQRFYLTREYFEIDLDVHNYAYLARKAFLGFYSRLDTVVFDNAFVIQGNRPEELPEQVLAAARLSYVDFCKVRPFPADHLEHINSAVEDGADTD